MENNHALFMEAKSVLLQLVRIINDLTFDEYTVPIKALTESSIGEHTRHIIEIFQELFVGYDSGIVNYDARKRNRKIQLEIDFAIECIAEIVTKLDRENIPLEIITVYNEHEAKIKSNYSRELMYAIEHCIHHQAIIKIGLVSLGITEVDTNFGVAKSTVNYRGQK